MEKVLVILMLIGVAVDLCGNLAFSPTYFRWGIPIYRTRLSFAPPRLSIDLDQFLTSQMHSDWAPSLIFRWVSDSEIGFREQVFKWPFKFRYTFRVRYTAVMHGLVQFSPIERVMVITGRVNWFPLGLFALVVGFVWQAHGGPRLLFLVFYLAIFGSCYWTQVSRYRSVTRMLSKHLHAAHRL